MQPLKKRKKIPDQRYVSDRSLESRVTENNPSEASTFICFQEIILSGYFLRRTVKKQPATEMAGDSEWHFLPHKCHNFDEIY